MPRPSSILTCGLLLLSALRLCQAAEVDSAVTGKKGTAKKAPATDPSRLSDKELKKRWGELLSRRLKILQAMEQVQADFETAKGIEQQKKVQIRFEELNSEFQREIAPPLNEMAEAVNKKAPSDPIAAQILVGRLLPERPRMLAPGQPRPQVPDENYARIVALAGGLTRDDAETKATIENILGMIVEDKRFVEAAAITERLVNSQGVTPRILLLAGLAQLYLSDFDRALALAQRAAAQGGVSPETAEFVQSCSDYVAFWKKEQQLRAQEQQADDLPRVLLTTTQGDIVLELFENEAPNTTANFISLVEAHKYDRLPFHRYEPNFVIQGGAINSDGKDRRNPERGGPGYAIACECYNGKARMHFRGSLSMAHAGKDTGGSQFFITHTPLPHLNWAPKKPRNNHTVFGRVIDGLEAALALRAGDQIESAKVLRKRDHAYVPETLDDVPPPATSRRKAKEDAVRK